MQISSIGQIAITVQDLGAAVAFYRDKLGLTFLFEAPVTAGGAPAMAFFMCGDVRILLGLPVAGHPVGPGSTLYFRVPDIAAAHAELAGKGVAFSAAPHVVHKTPGMELWLAEFRATDGGTHALMEERKV